MLASGQAELPSGSQTFLHYNWARNHMSKLATLQTTPGHFLEGQVIGVSPGSFCIKLNALLPIICQVLCRSA